MRYGRRPLALAGTLGCVLLAGCASKRQASQLPPPPTGNPIVDTTRGAGRTIVNGTKNGAQSIGRGFKSLVDPSTATTDPIDPLDPDRTARDDRSGAKDDRRTDDRDLDTSSDQASRPRTTTRVGARDLDVPVVDTVVLE
jgi:hypothetical protein